MVTLSRCFSILVLALLLAPAPARAQQLSRAEAVAQALAANPQVKQSEEQVALLEGKITEARADALPDISWNTTAMRSRDPGLLNSPNFDNFPPEFRTALSPLPANAFATTADFRQTLFSFKLGKALEAARLAHTAGEQELQRARQATTLDAVRSYNSSSTRSSSCVSSGTAWPRSRAIWISRRTAARRAPPRSSRYCARKWIWKISGPNCSVRRTT